jgi:hypothetical protein
MTQEEVDAVIRDALTNWKAAMHTHQLKFIKILCELKDVLESEAINHEQLKQEHEKYRAFVHHTLTREADLAAGLGLLTPPERLRDLASLLEKA